jgi:hypothetical protein
MLGVTTGVKQDQVGRNGLCVYVGMQNEEACSVLGASTVVRPMNTNGYAGSRDVRTGMTAHAPLTSIMAWRKHSAKQRFPFSPTPATSLRDKGLKLHTYQVIRFCIPACISSSPPQSGGL